MVYDSSNSGERDTDSSSGIGGEKVYKERAEPVLVSFSDLYLLLKSILVGASRFLVPSYTIY